MLQRRTPDLKESGRGIQAALGAILFSLPFFVSASSGWAQSGNQGSIEGVVTDPSGAVVPNVALRAIQISTSARFFSHSNEVGVFWFPVIPVGTYEIVAERSGFATLVVKEVLVTVGAAIHLPISLRLAEPRESVEARSATQLLEPTRSQVSYTVDRQSISDLPVNGRDFISFALLTPGVTMDTRGGLSFAGQRAMNSVLVDGVSYDDPYWGQALGAEGFGQGQYGLSLEAVQEFQVNTNAYSAEFGRAAGGVINVITKSGSNQFRGSGFWFFRDRSLNANNFLNNANGLPKDPYHYNQAGGVLGGPIRKDRMFFMASFDALRSNTPNTVVLGLPPSFQLSNDVTVASFQQKALDYLLPRARSWSLPLRQDDYLAKLDWQAAHSHRFSATWKRQRFTGLAWYRLNLGIRFPLWDSRLSDSPPTTIASKRCGFRTRSSSGLADMNSVTYWPSPGFVFGTGIRHPPGDECPSHWWHSSELILKRLRPVLDITPRKSPSIWQWSFCIRNGNRTPQHAQAIPIETSKESAIWESTSLGKRAKSDEIPCVYYVCKRHGS